MKSLFLTSSMVPLSSAVAKTCLVFLLAIVSTVPMPPGRATAQPPEQLPGRDLSGRTLSDSLWIADLDYLAEELPAVHKNLFFKISREEFSGMVDGLRHEIPNLEDYEIVVSMMRILAAVGDSHTMLSARMTGFFHKLPLLTEWFADGLYVVKAAPEYRAILGRRVLGIEGRQIEDASDMIASVIPHDNEAQLKTRGPHHFAIPEILAATGIAGTTAAVTFNMESIGDISVSALGFSSSIDWVTLLDTLGCDLPLYLRNQDAYYWFTYLEVDRLLYVQYRACTEMKSRTFASFTQDLFGFIDSHPVDRLVLDIRQNSGGSSALAGPLIRGLADRPAVNREGHLFVILGRKTFSSAILNALQLRESTKAIFVGEPTGGKPNHYGEVRFFMLPHSRLVVQYSTKYFAHSSENASSLFPDSSVDMEFSDFLSCRDPVLDAILTYEQIPD